MTLIWHIVKKDLRRFWLPIALLAVALSAKAEFLAIASDVHTASILKDDARFLQNPVALNGRVALYLITDLDLGSHLRTIMLGVVCVSDFWLLTALVLGVLLEHRTLGDKIFWRTRPIAGWQMLAAKAIFIFLIGWPWQAAMQATVNLQSGISTTHWYSALDALTLIQATWISFFALAVLLWRNPIVGATILATIGFGTSVLLSYFPDKWLPINTSPVGDEDALFIWLGTIAAIAALMYCKRKQSIGFLILGVGLVAMAVAVILL
jgi:hypothetical protein